MHIHGLQQPEAVLGCLWLPGKSPPTLTFPPHSSTGKKSKEKQGKKQKKPNWVKLSKWRKRDTEVIPHHLTRRCDAQPIPRQWLLRTCTPPIPLTSFGQEWCMWHDISFKISGKKRNWLLEAMQSVNACVCWPLSIVRTKSNVVQQGAEMFFFTSTQITCLNLFFTTEQRSTKEL